MIRACLFSCLIALPVLSTADQSSDLALEPSINGEVSRFGTFPTQMMEDQINAYLQWRSKSGSPYYLFTVAADNLTGTEYAE